MECAGRVMSTWGLTTPKSRCNAFKFQGTSCEIGRVSPLYGFLEESDGGVNFGHVLLGCSGNCKLFAKIYLCWGWLIRVEALLVSGNSKLIVANTCFKLRQPYTLPIWNEWWSYLFFWDLINLFIVEFILFKLAILSIWIILSNVKDILTVSIFVLYYLKIKRYPKICLDIGIWVMISPS